MLVRKLKGNKAPWRHEEYRWEVIVKFGFVMCGVKLGMIIWLSDVWCEGRDDCLTKRSA
jgi:hypothetical protein